MRRMRKRSGSVSGQVSFFDGVDAFDDADMKENIFDEPGPGQDLLRYGMEKDVYSFSEVCRMLSISAATGRNWIRLGKLVPVDAAAKRPVFDRSEIKRVLAVVEAGDRVLKSRRNKKKVTGASLYENYITNTNNISVINEILGQDRVQIDDDIMRIIIANFALQFICRLHIKNRAADTAGAGTSGPAGISMDPGGSGISVDPGVSGVSLDSGVSGVSMEPDGSDVSDVSGKPGGLYKSGNLVRAYLDNELEVYGFRPLIDDLLAGVPDCAGLAEKCGDILELELEYVPEEDSLGFAYISLKNMSHRKLSGAYYTPLPVVKELVGLVGETVSLSGRRILDPCCGTGNFLLYLASRDVGPELLYGQDSDELAVRIARINFALRFNITDMDFLKEHITCGDSLRTLPFPSYDLILGNPPWGYDYTADELAELAGMYRSASRKTAESYDLFVERCLALLGEGGLLAFVLPEAILNVRSHRTIRSILLEKAEFRFVSYLGNVFSKVQCPSIILGVSKAGGRTGTEDTAPVSGKGCAGCEVTGNSKAGAKDWVDTKGKTSADAEDDAGTPGSDDVSGGAGVPGGSGETRSGGINVYLDGETFTINPDRKFTPDTLNFHVSDEKQSCLDELCRNAEMAYLKGNARFALGIVTGNNRTYIADTALDGYEPVLRGSDIFKYRIVQSNAYMKFVPENFQQVAPTEMYRAPEKLLYRFICDTLVFAYDNRQMLSLNSCNILIPEIPGLEMKYVMAVLNSSAAAFFCQQNYNSVKVLRSHLETIPIPVVKGKAQLEVIAMVDRIMEPAAKVGMLYDELDDYLMKLYGLSAKHRDMIRRSLEGQNRFLPPGT